MIAAKPLSGVRSWLGWMALAATALVVAFVQPPSSSYPSVVRHIHLEASSFEYSPAIISVNPGDRVTLELASSDVVHGFYLDGYEVGVTADPGQPTRLTFVADQAGTFRFRCSVTCGPLHPFMTGKLQVGPNWLFWRSAGLAGIAAVGGTVLANRRRSGVSRGDHVEKRD